MESLPQKSTQPLQLHTSSGSIEPADHPVVIPERSLFCYSTGCLTGRSKQRSSCNSCEVRVLIVSRGWTPHVLALLVCTLRTGIPFELCISHSLQDLEALH